MIRGLVPLGRGANDDTLQWGKTLFSRNELEELTTLENDTLFR